MKRERCSYCLYYSGYSFYLYYHTLIMRLFAGLEFEHRQIELHAKLGEGALGELYAGILHTKHGCSLEVAIKTNKSTQVSKQQVEELMSEAKVMRHANHKNVVRIYGVAVQQEPLMIIMERVHGGALETYLEGKADKIPNAERLKICLQAALALEYTHTQDILHRFSYLPSNPNTPI